MLRKGNYFDLLNRKASKLVYIEFITTPTVNAGQNLLNLSTVGNESELIYKNWIKKCNNEVEHLSNGKIGYVHMNPQSFRDVYSNLHGKHRGKESIIVDTRFNGEGWLHDDLATLLNDKKYVNFTPRGQHIGTEPIAKW